MNFDPVLVVGTGRCGSSFVADVLHNDMNVFMGYRFPNPDYANEDGYWEDLDFQEANSKLLKGEIRFLYWLQTVQNVTMARLSLGKQWGFKDPRLSELLGSYFCLFDYPKIILVSRNKNLFIRSQLTRYKSANFTEQELDALFETRTLSINRFLRGRDYLQIHFDERRKTREEVAEIITAKWPELAPQT